MKKIVFVLLVAFILIAVAGCKQEESASKQKEEKQVTDNTEQKSGEEKKSVIDIAIFEGGLGGEYWNEMMEAYQEENPHVEFNVTMSPKVGEIIRPRVVAGDVPDFLVMTDGDQSGLLVSLIKDKALLDISDVFEEKAYNQDILLREYIADGFLESKKYRPYEDGKLYLAPADSGPRGLIYNRTLFEEKGWEVPETWDEFFALGDVAKEEGRALITYQGIYPTYLENFLLPAMANAAGIDQLDKFFNYEEGSFSHPDVLRVLEQFEKIANEGYLLEGTLALNHTQSQTEMMLGKALFIPNGPWMENEMKDSPREEGFEFGIMPAPVFNKGDMRYIYSNYGQYSIPAGAKNPEQAKDFLRFLYTEESAQSLAKYSNAVMAIEGGREITKGIITEGVYNMFEAFEYATPIFPDYTNVPAGSKVSVKETIYGNGATKVMAGEITSIEWAEIVEKMFAEIRDEREKEKE